MHAILSTLDQLLAPVFLAMDREKYHGTAFATADAGRESKHRSSGGGGGGVGGGAAYEEFVFLEQQAIRARGAARRSKARKQWQKAARRAFTTAAKQLKLKRLQEALQKPQPQEGETTAGEKTKGDAGDDDKKEAFSASSSSLSSVGENEVQVNALEKPRASSGAPTMTWGIISSDHLPRRVSTLPVSATLNAGRKMMGGKKSGGKKRGGHGREGRAERRFGCSTSDGWLRRGRPFDLMHSYAALLVAAVVHCGAFDALQALAVSWCE